MPIYLTYCTFTSTVVREAIRTREILCPLEQVTSIRAVNARDVATNIQKVVRFCNLRPVGVATPHSRGHPEVIHLAAEELRLMATVRREDELASPPRHSTDLALSGWNTPVEIHVKCDSTGAPRLDLA
jgi:hypothetical protein